jgi:hypothetical protein
MSIAPEEFDYERSRAAVTVACLQWLRCTGPAIDPEPSRVTAPDIAKLLREDASIVSPVHIPEPSHPLWDRWLDG